MTTRTLSAAFLVALCAPGNAAPDSLPAAVAAALNRENVVWDSPSVDAKGSMPIGNGDIGLNVWVEENGDLVLLVGKTDSFDEFNRLLKIGRVRLRTTPSLYVPGQTFSQILKLADGTIEIKSRDTAIRVWVDANHPVAQIDLKSASPHDVELTADNWRKENRMLGNEGPGSSSSYGNWPDKNRVNADTVLAAKDGQIGWCHHNVESQWAKNLELTALGAEVSKGKDPVLNRSFGAIVRAANSTAISDTALRTKGPTTHFTAQILSLTEFAETPSIWQKDAEAKLKVVENLPAPERFAAHQDWWRAFWLRSWIMIDPPVGTLPPPNSQPWRVGVDSNGGSRFRGEIAGASISDHALPADEIAALAHAPRPAPSQAPAGANVSPKLACTLSAWVKPAPGEAGRILDKCTAGTPDGLTFDTHPGLSLRWISGSDTMTLGNCLKAGEWQHVAATLEADGSKSIFINGKLQKTEKPAFAGNTLCRAYDLQRFVTACSGRGALPIKFNGSLFTVDGRDPDFRAWGGGYWFQNTREAYWAMLEAGDFEMMTPLFDMYRNALPLREAATKKYYGHEGAFFPETMYFWGNYTDENYGFDRTGKADGLTDNPYIRRYWQGGLELLAMMLDYHDDTQDPDFAAKTLLPYAKSITTFFDQHWPRKDGKIFFSPAQSIETWHTAANPLPEIAGLHYVLPRLLEFDTDAATKAMWRKTLADLPPVPIAEVKGRLALRPADTFSDKKNIENPELYAVFPYRLYTGLVERKELEPALNAWTNRQHPEDRGWQQNCIQAALLGLTSEAKTLVEARARNTAAGYRFPGFFGPNYDWTPEQCHGTNMMTALQRMLMQCEGNRIVLLPAWPKEWNGSFKLHAPHRTTVEGHVEDGKVVIEQVTPESRRGDIEMTPLK